MAEMKFDSKLLADRSSSLYVNASVLWLLFVGGGAVAGLGCGFVAARLAGTMFEGIAFAVVLLICVLAGVLAAASTVSLLQTIALMGLRAAAEGVSQAEPSSVQSEVEQYA